MTSGASSPPLAAASGEAPPPPPAAPSAPKIKQRKFANGDRYVGGWQNGLPDGEGKYEWCDGSCYEGGWKEGAKHGVGRYTWNSGASYQGEWQNGCMHGVGSFEAPDGSRYQGGWKEDLKHGLGKKVYANGDVYEGLWANGKPDGPGRYIWVDFNEYDGEWHAGRMNGQGTFVWKTGERYDGEWKDGQEDGVGVFTFRDGSTYSGFWRSGKKHGVGIFRPLLSSLSSLGPEAGSVSSRGGNQSMSMGGGRAAFADAAAAAAALPDEAAAVVLQPKQPGFEYQEPAVAAASKQRQGTSFEKQASSQLQLQPLQPQPPSQPPSDTVLVKEYKEGKLVHQYPLKGAKLAAICSAFNEGPGRPASRVSSASAAAAAAPAAGRGSRGHKQVLMPLGEVVYKEHSAYDLMVQLQLGIRWSLSSRSLEPPSTTPPQLQPTDYSATASQEFPRSGSRTTPVHPAADFMWKDYAPAVFRTLRELSGVQQHEYISQLCSDQALRLLASAGKSGAMFFLSKDEKLLVKTVTRAEGRLLLGMLQQYTQHMAKHPGSLLTHFYGLHRVAAPYKGGKKVRFVVMANIFCTDLTIHRRYDLKGSTAGRSRGEEAAEADMTVVLKDLDLHSCFRLDEGLTARLAQQLAADTALLAAAGIMDYSLLLGVHYKGLQGQHIMGQCPAGNFTHHTSEADLSAAMSRLESQLSGLNLDQRLSSALLELGRARLLGGLTDPSSSKGGYASLAALVGHSPTSVLATRPQRSPSKLLSAMPGASNPELGLRQLKGQLGQHMAATSLPLMATHQRSPSATALEEEELQGEDVVLFFGIIDVLQAYTFKKRLESGLKRLTAPAASISAVAPKYYASRFRKYLAQVFT